MPDEVHVPAVFDKVCLAGAVESDDFGPDEDQHFAEIGGWGLQQLEHIRKLRGFVLLLFWGLMSGQQSAAREKEITQEALQCPQRVPC